LKNNSNNAREKNDEFEFDDPIEYKGKKLFKPFVEKHLMDLNIIYIFIIYLIYVENINFYLGKQRNIVVYIFQI
jgi:hypothetical protein